MNYWNGWNYYLDRLPDLLLAVLVLIIGWIIAKVIEKIVLKGLKKTNLDNKLFRDKNTTKYSSEKIISKVVYYILLVFVFTLFFNILSLTSIASPLVSMLSSILGAVPNLLKAAIILVFAWLIASGLKYLIKKTGNTLNAHEKLQKWKLIEHKDQQPNLIDRVANIVFYFVLLLFLPAVLGALNLQGVSEPFTNMLHNMLAFLPKLLAAALIVFIGWFVAKIVRTIVTSFLQSIGTENFVNRLGLTKLFENTSLSSIIGNIIFIFIMIPTVISALDKLDIEGISAPAIGMLNDVLTMIPNIAVAIFFILIGVWLGKWLKNMVVSLLANLGLDSYVQKMGINPTASISNIIGSIVQILVIFLLAVQALNLIDLQFLVTLSTAVVAYLPQVIAAIVIIGVGIWLGYLVQKLLGSILQGNHFRLLPSIAKYAIIAVSVFMALDQLGVASSIVNSAFILILGGLALAFGLAFGLGGKEFAAKHLRKLDNAMENTTINKDDKNIEE
ncbi:mechanosensitive ion channel [Niallia sp. 03133]|uniref:mechanosensitive ion channel n=1 Tax=Niallia sp. 03133 TaxID=3458060 RepID=UPI0040440B52